MKVLSELNNLDMVADGEKWTKSDIFSKEGDDGSGYIWFRNGLLIQWGKVVVTPTAANTVTSLNVNYPISYDKVPDMKVIPQVQYPDLVTTSVGMGTTVEAGRTSFIVYMTRTNTSSTTFQWRSVGFKEVGS